MNKISHITLNSETTHNNHAVTKSYLDSVSENISYKLDLSTVLKKQDREFDSNKLTTLDSITAKWNPTIDNEVSNKNYLYYELNKSTILRFNQSLRSYFKVTVENTDYILAKHDRIQITDRTSTEYPNQGGYLTTME